MGKQTYVGEMTNVESGDKRDVMIEVGTDLPDPHPPSDPFTPQEHEVSEGVLQLDLRKHPNANITASGDFTLAAPLCHPGHSGVIYLYGVGVVTYGEGWRFMGEPRSTQMPFAIPYYSESDGSVIGNPATVR